MLAYAPTLDSGLVFDDHGLIGSPWIDGPLWRVWAGKDVLDYWPLTWSSLWLEKRVWADGTAGYHGVNILLHALAAWLLYRLLVGLKMPGALLAGLLFALHPVGVESVAWISERKNVLSGVLYLASLLVWAKFSDGGKRGAAVGSFVLFVLALLAKTSVVVLPVMLVGLVIYRRGRIRWDDVRRTGPFFAAALAFGMVTIWFQASRASQGLETSRALLERIGGAGWAALAYIQRAFVPVGLAFAYPEWPVAYPAPGFFVPAVLAILLVGVLGWMLLGRFRPIAVGLGLVLVSVLPVVGLIEMAIFHITPTANHLQYLSLMPATSVVAGSLAAWANGCPRRRRLATLAGGALLAIYGATTFQRARSFHDDRTFWEAAHRAAPGNLYAAWMQSDLLGTSGQRERALAVLEEAAVAAPDEASRQRARAFLQSHRGDQSSAAQAAIIAHRLRQNHVLDVEIGELLARSGAAEEAVLVLREVVRTWPRSPSARYWLGASLARAGRREEALAVVEEGRRLLPNDRRLRDAAALLRGDGRPAFGNDEGYGSRGH